MLLISQEKLPISLLVVTLCVLVTGARAEEVVNSQSQVSKDIFKPEATVVTAYKTDLCAKGDQWNCIALTINATTKVGLEGFGFSCAKHTDNGASTSQDLLCSGAILIRDGSKPTGRAEYQVLVNENKRAVLDATTKMLRSSYELNWADYIFFVLESCVLGLYGILTISLVFPNPATRIYVGIYLFAMHLLSQWYWAPDNTDSDFRFLKRFL